MKIKFHKYQGTGNDFIMVNGFEQSIDLSSHQIANLCSRRFGIGADGLIILKKEKDLDFYMDYYNSDGKPSSMCGNGGRCAVKFAYSTGVLKKNNCTFNAIDGKHEATILEDDIVSLKMIEPYGLDVSNDKVIVNTGSPHVVFFKEEDFNLAEMDLQKEGSSIRNSPMFIKNGINVNFTKRDKDLIYLRTYERGVEAETLSCGTGNVATAIAHAINENAAGVVTYNLKNKGGDLNVRFSINEHNIKDVWLTGQAVMVFKGEINIVN
ncbi:MAG: diaminopimelate epimerase [Chitinophagaceae bacterium]|nr:MAG: diaminopimelate epimerase [Chitinophagaceae bacterium]